MHRKPKKADLIRQYPLSSTPLFAIRAEQTNHKTVVTVLVPTRLFSKAVDRNRVRRQVREAALAIEELPQSGWTIIFSVRSKELPSGRKLQEVLFDVLKKSGIVSR